MAGLFSTKPAVADDRPASAETSAPTTAHRRRLSLPKRVAFSAIVLIASWLLCELGAFVFYWLFQGRLFSWQKTQADRLEWLDRPSRQDANLLANVHPYSGYVEEPGADSGLRSHRTGQPVPVSDFGYIDDKSPLQPRGPDRVVVAILGGSVACHFAINGTDRLAAELAAGSPAYAGKRYVFVNLALGGYKEPQQLTSLAYLMSLGAEYDLVLNIDGFNEVALHELENASHHVFPAFPRSWFARVGTADPVLGLTRGRLLVLEDERTRLALWHSRAPWRYSVLANLVWEYRDRRLEWDSFQILNSHYTAQNPRGSYLVTGPRMEFGDQAALAEELASIWSNSSAALHGLCSGRGMRYFHFLQPNQYVEGSKPMSAEERKEAVLANHPYRDGVERGYPLLRRNGRTLAAQGIAFHDLTDVFAEHPERLYTDGCCHFNQAGLEIVAQAIARAILEADARGPIAPPR
jgi:hypothetical protein